MLNRFLYPNRVRVTAYETPAAVVWSVCAALSHRRALTSAHPLRHVQAEVPKPSEGIEYTYARKPAAFDHEKKDLAHIWEVGGSQEFAEEIVTSDQLFLTAKQASSQDVMVPARRAGSGHWQAGCHCVQQQRPGHVRGFPQANSCGVRCVIHNTFSAPIREARTTAAKSHEVPGARLRLGLRARRWQLQDGTPSAVVVFGMWPSALTEIRLCWPIHKPASTKGPQFARHGPPSPAYNLASFPVYGLALPCQSVTLYTTVTTLPLYLPPPHTRPPSLPQGDHWRGCDCGGPV